MKTRYLIPLLVLLFLLTTTMGVLHFAFSIPNRARVKGVGVSIWWDYNCTLPVSEIDWGMIEPNQTKTTAIYIKSVSNVNITLTLSTQNWNPQEASQFITLTWNYTGTPLTPKSVTPIELYLHVAHNVTGIDHFAFDIIIYAAG